MTQLFSSSQQGSGFPKKLAHGGVNVEQQQYHLVTWAYREHHLEGEEETCELGRPSKVPDLQLRSYLSVHLDLGNK